MRTNIRISTKITGLVIVIVIVTVTAISYLSFNLSKSLIQKRYEESLHLIAKERAEKIESYFSNIVATLKLIQQTNLITVEEEASQATDSFFPLFDEPEIIENTETNEEEKILHRLKNVYGLKSVNVLTAEGELLQSTESVSKFVPPEIDFLTKSASSIHFSTVIQRSESIYCGVPLESEEGKNVLVVEISMGEVFDILSDSTGLGKTGENLIARAEEGMIQYLVPFRGDTVLSAPIPFDSTDNARPIKEALLGKNGTRISTDYSGEEILAVWRYIPVIEWGLVAKVDLKEVMEESGVLVYQYVLSGVVIVILSSLISIIFSNYLISPLLFLKSTLEYLGKGILPEKVEVKTNDEIDLMAKTLNNHVQSLKKTAGFARDIGKGNFEAEFRPLSEDDMLGQSLISMRDNLLKAEKREKERNWIITGMAELSAILRIYDDLDSLGDGVIKYVNDRIEAVQGAFYVTVDDEARQKSVEMRAVYAYNRKKYVKKTFSWAEGLVGQAVAEKSMIMRTEIPADYLSITSGLLGDQKPSCILIIPLITDEQIYGVLEFAGFKPFDDTKIKFIEELSVSLARTVFNIKVSERTRKLLDESTAMSTELKEKQEVLRQNAEEMQATQEELEHSNQKLEEQIEEVNRTQNRMQLLLENASEVITIYEKDGTVRYISPSVEPILGYSQKEMIAKKDLEKVHPQMTSIVEEMFSNLIKNPQDQVTCQYRYKSKEGEYIWLETTGTNFLSNAAIQGIITNSRDITERRRAEEEQRMRSKMQALSENSPDLITRLENKKISYINPVIEEYTGNGPLNYLSKSFNEIDLEKEILDRWLNIVEEVNAKNEKVSTEMDFPTDRGNRIMQVNAIPEYDDLKNLESVLLVSHDITERKLIELEIQNKNKKIADSINYAKRIQNAILPNNTIINNIIPDSFILYKPKDVVSGDFPWFAHIGNYVYMAAVDCTGHGVPGALLSLIGYFLLNDIVRSRKITDPGQILDQLDEGVTQTLRQDQANNSAKDGMDIGLCRINLETREISYAGAHRPLYIMKNNEMEEIKGNKFAIGGGIYKNQTNFTSHTVSLKPGDSIYYCSDGFPDQFGGPELRKYGPKRLRENIVSIYKKSMKEAHEYFDTEWEAWRGDEKQTDDVLLIGIKFH